MRNHEQASASPKRRPTPRRVLMKFLLATCSWVFALLLLEIFLRVYNPFQARVKGNRIVLVAGETYHIRNDHIRRLDPQVTVTRNSLGFRGPEPPADFAGHLTLVAIGGSTTQCFFLSDEQTWPARLGGKLEGPFQRVWVNNAGLDGHSTNGHLVLLEDFVAPLRPDVALFLVGVNDIAADSIRDFEAENVRDGVRLSSAKGFVKSLSAYSEVVSLSLNTYRSLTAYRMGLTHKQVDLERQGYSHVAGADEERRPDAQTGELLKGYTARLERLADASRRAGIEPVFITQPMLLGSGTDDVTGVDLARVKINAERDGQTRWKELELYNDITRRVGRERGVFVIDLARRLPKTSRYFYDAIHYTPQGAQAVAELVYGELAPLLRAKFPQHVSRPAQEPPAAAGEKAQSGAVGSSEGRLTDE